MKTSTMILCLGLTLSARLWIGAAQEPPGQIPHGPASPVHQPPLAAALDVNKDGVVDSTELANASAALQALDLNGDGQLVSGEIQPPIPHARTQRPVSPDHMRRPPQPLPETQGESFAPPSPPPAPHADAEGKPLPPPPPPAPVIVVTLDTNHDGAIDAAELANAPVTLMALDKNSDGQLTADEYNPQRQPGSRKILRHQGDGSGQHRGMGPDHRSPTPAQE